MANEYVELATRVDGGLRVSRSDTRSFASTTLSNGLRVVVVSHPQCDMAAASLHVRVGSNADDSDVPGLAHFCEHMLFMGTHTHPGENTYSEYLADHAGWSNAWTSGDGTNYHFEVGPQYLKGALDIFAPFFICPLFSDSATARELNAVDSEHAKNLQSDFWRLHQLKKSLCDPSHPFYKFGTGDSRTLRDIPRAAGVDVRARLLAFHTAHYSAGRMSLVLYGRESTQELLEAARIRFEGVVDNGSAPPVHPSHPMAGRTGIRVHAVPVKDVRYVELLWGLPSQKAAWRRKPADYLSHLIGHEGAGSILAHLKARGWATDLSAGLMDDDPDWASFGAKIGLTEDGLAHVDDVTHVVYAYLRVLRVEGPQEWVWRERAAQAAASFRYLNMTGASSYATSVAAAMAEYPLEYALCGESLCFEFDADSITSTLNALTPANSTMTVVSKTFAGAVHSVEQWYGTQYEEVRQSDELVARCDALLAGTATLPADAGPTLRLPDPNEFLATEFELRHPRFAGRSLEDITRERAEAESAGPLEPQPGCIIDDDRMQVWHHLDDHFAVPKAYLRFDFTLPAFTHTPRAAALNDLFVRLLKEALVEFAYAATCASLQYSIEMSSVGVLITAGGFSHKLPMLVSKLTERMTSLSFTDGQFAIEKDRALRALRNFDKEQPYQHAIYYTSVATVAPRISNEERLSEMETVTSEELRALLRAAFTQCHVVGQVVGNYTRDEAAELTTRVLAPVLHGCTPLPLSQRRIQRVVALPSPVVLCDAAGAPSVTLSADIRYVRAARNPADANGAMEYIIQVGPQQAGALCRQNVMTDLVGHLLAEPFFDTLRTKQQLGYITHASVKSEVLVDSLRMIVQSTKVDALELVARTEAFLDAFPALIEAMPEERFTSNIAALVAQKKDGAKNLSAAAAKLWPEVQTGSLDFSRASHEIAILSSVKQADVVIWLREHVLTSGRARRVFVSLVERPTPSAVAAAVPAKEAAHEHGDDCDCEEDEDEAAEEVSAPVEGDGTMGKQDTPVAAPPRALSVATSIEQVAVVFNHLAASVRNAERVTVEAAAELMAAHGVSFDAVAARDLGAARLVCTCSDAASVRSMLPLYEATGQVRVASWRRAAAAAKPVP